MNDDKEPTEEKEGGGSGQITQETLDNANQEVGHQFNLFLGWVGRGWVGG